MQDKLSDQNVGSLTFPLVEDSGFCISKNAQMVLVLTNNKVESIQNDYVDPFI